MPAPIRVGSSNIELPDCGLARRYRTRDRATSARPGPGLFYPMALGYHLRRLGWHQGHGSDIDGGRRFSGCSCGCAGDWRGGE
jgi:hypothetical protein